MIRKIEKKLACLVKDNLNKITFLGQHHKYSRKLVFILLF